MFRKNKWWAIAFAAILLILVACSSSNDSGTTSSTSAAGGVQRGGTLKLADANDVVTLDNSQAVSTIDYSLTAGALYEGLYHVDESGNVVAALAQDMPSISKDQLVYTIKIRPDAMFAGPHFTPRAVTAQDAAYGMERALDPNTKPGPSWGGGYLFPIEGAAEFASGKANSVSGIKVVDPSTLQITLDPAHVNVHLRPHHRHLVARSRRGREEGGREVRSVARGRGSVLPGHLEPGPVHGPQSKPRLRRLGVPVRRPDRPGAERGRQHPGAPTAERHDRRSCRTVLPAAGRHPAAVAGLFDQHDPDERAPPSTTGPSTTRAS